MKATAPRRRSRTRTPAPSDTQIPGQLWTVRELAQRLSLHEKTIYDWIARGQLPCIRLGHRLRFDPHDILRWLAARKEG